MPKGVYTRRPRTAEENAAQSARLAGRPRPHGVVAKISAVRLARPYLCKVHGPLNGAATIVTRRTRRGITGHLLTSRKCRICRNAALVRRTPDLKRQVVDGYGGSCACCQESCLEFLTVDHIHGRNRSRRRERNIYRRLIREGFQDGFRVLCMNCNFSHRAVKLTLLTGG
jgi:hypothetical protein